MNESSCDEIIRPDIRVVCGFFFRFGGVEKGKNAEERRQRKQNDEQDGGEETGVIPKAILRDIFSPSKTGKV